MSNFFETYLSEYSALIETEDISKKLEIFKSMALNVKKQDSKIIFAGNGASASISAHGAVDFSKQGSIRGITFNEANLITCFSNDFGYENIYSEALGIYASLHDLVVLISVSGESQNVINAAKKAKEMKLKVVTFSGKDNNNRLKSMGDLNFWVDSHAYNKVECVHMIWLTAVIDAVIGNAIYSV